MIVINNALTEIPDESFPIGGIVLWYGISSAIPTGYSLCSGIGGTPDIRNKFVYGASVSGDLLVTGGATTHVHGGGNTSSTGGHSHSTGALNWPASTYNTSYYYTPTTTVATSSHTHSSSGATVSSSGGHSHGISGTTDMASTIPPYKKLYWIKRIS
jgi:hypothetical protein